MGGRSRARRTPAHVERVWQAAQERGGVAGIVLTHRHLDHAQAVPELRERFGSAGRGADRSAAQGGFEEPSLPGLEPDVVLERRRRGWARSR